MSYVIAAPEMMTAAVSDLAGVESALSAANAAATARTTAVLAAGTDEVSAAIAALFSAHGQGYQALSVQAAAFHDEFVRALAVGAGSYASAEAAAAKPLQTIRGRPGCRAAGPGRDRSAADRGARGGTEVS